MSFLSRLFGLEKPSWRSDGKGSWTRGGEGDAVRSARISLVPDTMHGIPLYTLTLTLRDGRKVKDRTIFAKRAEAEKAAARWFEKDEDGDEVRFSSRSFVEIERRGRQSAR